MTEFYSPMGATKRYMELVESRGWADVGATICSECLTDEALVEAVRSHGGDEPCDFCDETPGAPEASAPFEVVLELVVDGIRHEYEDPVEGMAWDGGYVGTVHDTWDLLWDLGITESPSVHRELVNAIQQDQWCQRDPYAATPTEALTWGWEAFRQYVKHRRRYTFLAVDHSTADGAGMIPMHAMPSAVTEAVEAGGLVKEVPAGTEWWRVRVHDAGKHFSTASDLGTPPETVAKDNRMSAKGVGAFYGASTSGGARAEVAGYAKLTQEGTVGCFRTTVPLTVVDLRELPAVPSLFDPARRHLRAHTQFLRGFVRDVTKVADPSEEQDLDYVPTQVIAETFRYDLPVDGVLWASSKDKLVTSCVLFAPSTEVADLGKETKDTKLVLDPATVAHIGAPL
jgi:hypothetical protein